MSDTIQAINEKTREAFVVGGDNPHVDMTKGSGSIIGSQSADECGQFILKCRYQYHHDSNRRGCAGKSIATPSREDRQAG